MLTHARARVHIFRQQVRMPLLVRLELIDVKSFPDHDLSSTWCGMTHLKSLTIRACEMEHFALHKHPALTHLVVESCIRLRHVAVVGCLQLRLISLQWSAVRSLTVECPLVKKILTTGCRFDQLEIHSDVLHSLVGLSVCWNPAAVKLVLRCDRHCAPSWSRICMTRRACLSTCHGANSQRQLQGRL